MLKRSREYDYEKIQKKTPDATPRARKASRAEPARSPTKDVESPQPARLPTKESAPTKDRASPTTDAAAPTKETSEARVHSNSFAAPAQPSRKRTSSGVFQVDETEPLPKKPEIVRSNSENSRKRPINGRKEKDAKLEKTEKKVIERFDTEAETKCVSAFKESDSWD